ncbi:class I SAM-dependent methyltransferase [Pararhodospirillum oryzae]|nr:methyltransferase domain-containing protein [Pararhodospirillum oryzae]
MAEQIKPFTPHRILDVGCGSGHGILALFDVLGKDIQVVALDENPVCLKAAAQILVEGGVDATFVKRLKPVLTTEGFAFEAAPLVGPFDGRCTLVEADICNDPGMIQALVNDSSFDLITIWLTGTHMMRKFNKDVRSKNIESDGMHRLYVQNRVYELADRILKSGGVLQVVDRSEAPTTEEMRDDCLNAHRDQASVTSLDVKTLEYLPYDEPQTSRTPMIFTPSTSGRVPKQFQPAITSVISIKP